MRRNRFTAATLTATLVAVLSAGCADEPAGSPSFAYAFEPIAEYGCVDCVGDELFGLILAIDHAPDGSTTVLTASPPHLRLFDADGTSRSFGPSGDGPGELRGAGALAVLDDGRILVASLATDVFGPDGTFIERRSEAGDQGFRVFRSISSPSGEWALHLEEAVRPREGMRLRLHGDDLDSVRTFEIPDEVFTEDENRRNRFALRFAVADDGRVAVGSGDGDYRLVLLDSDGMVVDTVERDVPMPVRSEGEVAELQRRLDEGPGGGQARASEVKAHMRHVRFDPRGRLWVQTSRGEPGTTIFDLFTVALDYVGEVTLGVETDVFDLAAGELVAETRGPFDTPLIRAWRFIEP